MRRARVPVVALALVLTGVGCGSGFDAPSSAKADADHALVGAPAPGFDLEAQHGASRVSLADLGGKVVIVDFWATWCEPCKKSFPAYQKLSHKFAGKLSIVGISVDEEPDGIAAFAAETGVSFPLAWDSDQSVAAAYSPPTMPTSYVIDKNGIVRHVHDGYRPGDEVTLEKHVAELVKE